MLKRNLKFARLDTIPKKKKKRDQASDLTFTIVDLTNVRCQTVIISTGGGERGEGGGGKVIPMGRGTKGLYADSITTPLFLLLKF